MKAPDSIRPGSLAARVLFPASGRYAYLNHAAASPLSTRAAGAMRQWIDHWSSEGARVAPGHDFAAEITTVRATFSQIIGARPEEIAITGNTSDGLLLVALGLDWREGDNLVTAEGEFTANVYPWQQLTERGVEIRRVPMAGGRVLPERLAAACDSRTRLLTLSFVSFFHGFRHDLTTVAEIAHRCGALLVVDAVQGAGAFPIDVAASGIDFLATGSHKWLMGPLGAGIFFVRERLIDQLRPGRHGWLSTAPGDIFFDYTLPLSPTASRFEPGAYAFPSVMGLAASISLLLEVGVAEIADHLLDLGDRLLAGLTRTGCEIVSPVARREERSGITTFRHPRLPADDLLWRLDEAGVVVSARGNAVRVSPHFYNTADDIDRLLDVVAAI